MVQISGQIYPNKENHEIYQFYYDKYIKSYFSMKDLMHEVSRRINRNQNSARSY